MARVKADNKDQASSVDGSHAQLLYHSLDQYNQEQKRRRRPSIVLGALVCLVISSAGGIALAIILMLQPVEIHAACIARDLILFAAAMTLLYIGLHIRAARKDYKRRGPGPPQIYGEYLHASALLVARLAIAVWIAALIATAVMIAKAGPFEGFAKKIPFLNLLICIGAIPPFLIISITIEKNPTPFATTGFSRSSFLTCRVSEFADDLAADMSVSRRASLQRKQSMNGSVMTLPTAEIFQYNASKLFASKKAKPAEHPIVLVGELPDDKTELMANSPVRTSHPISSGLRPMPSSSVPPVPKLPHSLSKSPQPTYNPGGWRNEWNNVAEQVGVSKIPPSSTDRSGIEPSAYHSSAYSDTSGGSSHTSTPHKYTSRAGGRHHATPSTSIANDTHRSRLSTVRYASEPEVAVRQAVRVVTNPAYSLATTIAMEAEREAIKPPRPVAVLRNAQQAQKVSSPTLIQETSSLSHPIPTSRDSVADSAIEMKVPGTYVDETTRT
ncbi:hypothetical protein F4779DRAFT_628928 [Xylariaceae sp. FL0662B]|nr:hypothetical protein F4779DRAFT_628928 [Xylariaceae sp. FL0662B]